MPRDRIKEFEKSFRKRMFPEKEVTKTGYAKAKRPKRPSAWDNLSSGLKKVGKLKK